MSDNITLNSGSGGDTAAADDISGVKYQRVKITLGADGVNDGDVSSSNAMPVSLASVPSHAVTNAGTFAVQAAQSGTWNVGTVTAVTGITNAVAVTDNGGSLTVDGTVAVTGTFWQATQPVSIASAVAVTDNSGSLTVDGSVSIAAVATGGATFSKVRSAASTNTTNLKASAGKVVSIFLQNNGTVQQFVKLHNVSSTPTAGSSVAMTFVVNPGDTVTWHGGDQGMAFGTGIGYSITAGQAESDTANATADAVLGVITWL